MPKVIHDSLHLPRNQRTPTKSKELHMPRNLQVSVQRLGSPDHQVQKCARHNKVSPVKESTLSGQPFCAHEELLCGKYIDLFCDQNRDRETVLLRV